ncbi:hypothetical protein [Streptosporangium roseum]|uniref:hypothetical protein n=1 Tax=Streptosporangium roseum TaxID=2001 RepID=UPI00331BB41F
MEDVVDRAVSMIWSSMLDVFTPIRRHTWSGPDLHRDFPRDRLSVISMNPASSEPGRGRPYTFKHRSRGPHFILLLLLIDSMTAFEQGF